MRKVLIVPDKFKGSLSAEEVCKAIATGLKQREKSLEFIFHPMADGGDGSLAILTAHLGLREEKIKTTDPLGRVIEASYFTSDKAAFVELASASGLVLLTESERNPFYTSTFGTGEIIRHVITKGYQNIYLFLGGSATNDAGMGIAQALGFRFLNAENKPLRPIGENLPQVTHIQQHKSIDFSKTRLILFCDVLNPLFGKNGAAQVYAPQKGATAEQVRYLDQGLVNFSKIMEQQTGIDVSSIAGIGAAGGVGASLVALCGAKLENGFSAIASLSRLEEKIQQADWVISGEGQLDEQSLKGKVVNGVADFCRKYQKPLTLFVGKNELHSKALESLGVQQVFSISTIAENTKDGMSNAASYLEQLAKNS